MSKCYAVSNPNITNWISDVNSLMIKLVFENVCLNQGVEKPLPIGVKAKNLRLLFDRY